LSGWADRAIQRDTAAEAVADDIRAWDLEVVEQRGHIVGEVIVGEVTARVSRAAMTLHFDGDHFPRFGKFTDPLGPVEVV